MRLMIHFFYDKVILILAFTYPGAITHNLWFYLFYLIIAIIWSVFQHLGLVTRRMCYDVNVFVVSTLYIRGHQVRSWRAGVPAEFSSNPNQTHLKQLIKLLLGILETSRQVCWGKLELNSAGHRPSRIKFDDPCSTLWVNHLHMRLNLHSGRLNDD